MCLNRFDLLWNLKQKPLSEVIQYVNRLVKAYALFTILYVVLLILQSIATPVSHFTVVFALAVINIVLLASNIFVLHRLAEFVDLGNATLSCGVYTTSVVFSFVQLIINIVVAEQYSILIGGAVALVIRFSTLYILVRTREKISKGETLASGRGGMAEQEDYAVFSNGPVY
jgi:hypothetical protein